MHIVALLLESNTAIAATQMNKLICCRALANREKNAFRVTRPMISRVVQVPWNDLVETSSSSCLVIRRRASGVAAMVLVGCESEIQESCCFFFVSFSSSRIVATLHITFSWLPLPIGQVCSQVWCRPYLAAHFGFFDLRTFLWSLSQVRFTPSHPK